MKMTDQDRKEEAIGRAIVNITYWFYSFIRIAVFSVIALIVLFFLDMPLWLSPLIGILAHLICRALRRFVFGGLIRFGRWSSK